jgi:hypothetical protein
VSISERRPYNDPFALQAYSEIIQTIFLYEQIYVPHPIYLYGCSKEDFGDEPKFLMKLLDRGIVKPLNLDPSVASRVEEDEKNLLHWLQKDGAEQLDKYLTAMQREEKRYLPMNPSFKGVTLSRLRDWAQYHYVKVRDVNGHHPSRIPTKNGIEEDSIGDFARSFSYIFRKKLSYLGEKQIDYLVATILRAFRYRIRANIAEIFFQSHPMRRQFVLRYDFHDSRISADVTKYVINLIRGVSRTIEPRLGRVARAKLQLLDFEVPLLGGKLWKKEDINLHRNSWIEFVVNSIENYRDETKILRNYIRDIRDREGIKKLKLDFEVIQEQLLEIFGSQRSTPTETDKELVNGGLATTGKIPGFPNAHGLLINVPSPVKRKRRVFSGTTPLREFLYKEFLRGWEETK